jgi:hypothetical protein
MAPSVSPVPRGSKPTMSKRSLSRPNRSLPKSCSVPTASPPGPPKFTNSRPMRRSRSRTGKRVTATASRPARGRASSRGKRAVAHSKPSAHGCQSRGGMCGVSGADWTVWERRATSVWRETEAGAATCVSSLPPQATTSAMISATLRPCLLILRVSEPHLRLAFRVEHVPWHDRSEERPRLDGSVVRTEQRPRPYRARRGAACAHAPGEEH